MTSTENPGLIGGRDHFHDFDFDFPEFNEHYDEVLDRLLEQCPVAHSKAFGGYWLVSRAEDFRRCASDHETFTTTLGFDPSRSNEEGGHDLPRVGQHVALPGHDPRCAGADH